MNFKSALACLVIFSLLLVGCEVGKSPTETPVTPVFTPFEVEYVDFSKRAGDCDVDSSAMCTKVEIHYAILTDSVRVAVAEEINAQIEEYVINSGQYDTVKYSSAEELAKDFIGDFNALQSDYPEAFGWELAVDGNFLRNDSLYVSAKIQTDLFTGGAHGNSFVQYFSFDPISGKKLKLDDILAPGYNEKINALALAEFRNTHEIGAEENPEARGFTFEDNQYFNPDNFAMLADGLIFYFNNYEIAPYSEGPTTLKIPLESLRELLQK